MIITKNINALAIEKPYSLAELMSIKWCYQLTDFGLAEAINYALERNLNPWLAAGIVKKIWEETFPK